MSAAKNLAGIRFGRLTAERRDGSSQHKKALWFCRCDCGDSITTLAQSLTEGKTTSCGCRHVEELRYRMTRHGQARHFARTSLYQTWAGIKARCLNPANDGFKNYGGRGIQMCQEWADSFESFAAAVGERPDPSYSIDRIDNNGNYEPGNVRWATKREQALNRRHRDEWGQNQEEEHVD